MAAENFIFRKNWVGSEVAGMKIVFFVISDPTWTHILAPTAQVWNFFNKILILNPLEKQKLHVTLRLTN